MSLGGAQRAGSTGALECGIPSPDIPWPALSQLMTVCKPLPWTAHVLSLCSPLSVTMCPVSAFPVSSRFQEKCFLYPASRKKRETPTKPNKFAEVYRQSRFPSLSTCSSPSWTLLVWTCGIAPGGHGHRELVSGETASYRQEVVQGVLRKHWRKI